jgi:hypothetical protein
VGRLKAKSQGISHNDAAELNSNRGDKVAAGMLPVGRGHLMSDFSYGGR